MLTECKENLGLAAVRVWWKNKMGRTEDKQHRRWRQVVSVHLAAGMVAT